MKKNIFLILLTGFTTVQQFYSKYLSNVGSNYPVLFSQTRTWLFLFVDNFEQVLSFDYFSYFSRLYYHHYFHCCHFILFFATNIVITSVVTISAFFSFLLVCFVSYLYMVVDLFYVSNKKTSWFIFHICYLLWAYILCIVASLITFRFMNFDTDRLYIASLLNFDCNGHLDVVCVKLK